MSSSKSDRQTLTKLRKMLVQHFKREELVVLSFDVNMDYEDLEGTTKDAKMHDLILKLNQRGQLQNLVNKASQERPQLKWPDVSEASEPEDPPEKPRNHQIAKNILGLTIGKRTIVIHMNCGLNPHHLGNLMEGQRLLGSSPHMGVVHMAV